MPKRQHPMDEEDLTFVYGSKIELEADDGPEPIVPTNKLKDCLEKLYPEYLSLAYEKVPGHILKKIDDYTNYSDGADFNGYESTGIMAGFPLLKDGKLYISKRFFHLKKDLDKQLLEPETPILLKNAYILYMVVVVKVNDEFFLQPRILHPAKQGGHQGLLTKSEQKINAKEMFVVGGGEILTNEIGEVMMTNNRTGAFHELLKTYSFNYAAEIDRIFSSAYAKSLPQDEIFYFMTEDEQRDFTYIQTLKARGFKEIDKLLTQFKQLPGPPELDLAGTPYQAKGIPPAFFKSVNTLRRTQSSEPPSTEKYQDEKTLRSHTPRQTKQ